MKVRAQIVLSLLGSLIALAGFLHILFQPAAAVLAQDPSPHIDVWVDTHSVSGYQWPNGASITLTIVDPQNGTYQPAPRTFSDSVQFDIPDTFPLSAGQQVTLTDGTTTRTTTIAALPAPTLDMANSQIYGMTDPGATVWIYLCNQDGCVNRWITADPAGAYLFDFMAGEGAHIHLYPGDNSSVNVADGSGNNTSRSWRIPKPNIMASVNKRWVNAREWPTGQALTLSINDVVFGTAEIGPAPWDPSYIVANFNPPVLQEGDVLTITNADHSITKSLALASLKLTDINLASSTLSGMAPPNSMVSVGLKHPTDCITRKVPADAQGQWSADFSTPNFDPGNCGSAVFGPGIEGWVTHFDEDRDSTILNWAMPHIDVFLNRHAILAYDWAVGIDLTLTVTQPSGPPYIQTVTNGGATSDTLQGFTRFNLPQEVLLAPGQQVTVSDGIISQTTTLQGLGRPDIDQAHSRLSGTASQGAVISTCLTAVDVWPCIPRAVTVGASGEYSLDFSTPGPNPGEQLTRVFQPNDGGILHWADPLGNHTSLDWSVAAHTLHVNPQGQEIHGHDWPLGVQVTLTLDDPGTGAHKTAATTVVDLPNQCGAPCFWMSDLGWTLAPGQVIQMSTSLATKTVTVSPLLTTRIDALHDQLAGKASPNSPVTVGESTPGSLARWVQADANGDWAVDFSIPPTTGEPSTVDLLKNSHGRVLQINPPGWGQDDGTLQYWIADDPMVLSSTQIDENASAGSTVGTFSPQYPEVVQALGYTLIDGEGDTDNAAFSITGSALKINASPNFESKSSYSIRVRVADSLAPGKSYETTYIIDVANVDEPASQISLSSSAIAENSPAGSQVGAFSQNDPDAGETYTYSLVSGDGSADNAAFTIAGSALRLSAAPDFETQPVYHIRVRAAKTGQPGAFLEQALEIAITNLEEPPVVTGFQKSGFRNQAISFAAIDFSIHFVSLETSGLGALEKGKITALPAHGSLHVNGGVALAQGSEILAVNLGLLSYQPENGYTGSDAFTWTAAGSGEYAVESAPVNITIGAVNLLGFTVSPASDAKSARAGSIATYTLFVSNTGNVGTMFAWGYVGAWPGTVTPSDSFYVIAGGQAQLTIQVRVPPSATGQDTAHFYIDSYSTPNHPVIVDLTTTVLVAPLPPPPVLLNVSPASVSSTALSATALTLSGANFTRPMTVTVGGVPSPAVTYKSSVELLAAAPIGLAPGVYPVQACDSDARCVTLPDAFTVFNLSPTVLSVYPGYGQNTTPNPVTITGYNLSASTTFTLWEAGLALSPVVELVSGSSVQVTIPAGLAPGPYALRVCNGPACSFLLTGYVVQSSVQNDFAADSADLWTSPVTIREGNTIQLGLNVHRVSGVGLSAVQVAFYRDDPNVPANRISPLITTASLPVGAVWTVSAPWSPVGITGSVRIFAVIDPNGLQSEATRANNTVSRILQILPREIRDEAPPMVNSFTINGGAYLTSLGQVALNLYALDNPGGSGLNVMYFTERVWNNAAQQWVIAKSSGWVPYQSYYPMVLTGQSGIHYIEAWVSDRAGNTSSMVMAQINYQPPTNTIAYGQVQYYRIPLNAGQPQHILVETLSGDADLRVRDPDGNVVAYSSSSSPVDRVDFTTRLSGTYQVEVYGYQPSAYRIFFDAGAPAGPSAAAARGQAASDKVDNWPASISVQNQPASHNPSTPAPITANRDDYYIYVPALTR